MKRRAFSLLPRRFEDGRHEAMENGLRRIGYMVTGEDPQKGGVGDVMIGWGGSSFHQHRWSVAEDFRARGGRVIYAEEAYFRNVRGEKHFALALDGHNGSGRWPDLGPERWESWGLEIAPWRPDPGPQGRVIVRAQRGIGTPLMASPPDWHLKTAEKLKALTRRPVVIREHHKTRGESVGQGLVEVLAHCWAVVTWASSIAPRALLKGWPAFICAPHSVAMPCNAGRLEDIERPVMPDRLPMFQRLAWAQWSTREIESGAAFAALLEESGVMAA